MLVIAHRGANKEALENSWQAFEAAIAGGAERIELDVHLTADGEIAINHDLELIATTGRRGDISGLSRGELESWPLKNGDPIPFLDQVIEKVLPRVELNIEIKGNSEGLAEKVALMVEDSGLDQKVVISSFCYEPLVYLWRHHPHLRRACLWGDWPRWPWLSYQSPLVMMHECRANIFHPYTDWLDENIMEQAKARGWLVFPYVSMRGEEEDKQKLWSWLQSIGVDGLCTNYPRQMRQWLKDLKSERSMIQRLAQGAEAHDTHPRS